ncbi:Uma2 family endonuclease [Altericista sp. CCNU0014]|uniref:Uma2 family endonuclease n=1 Tax=Altericista sp. CCNU0014 TaxID=3082949 RepID=UPI00384D52F7
MTQSRQRFATFEAYLSTRDDREGRFLLIDGELFELPPESPENDFVANYLMVLFLEAGVVPLQLIRVHTCEVQVPVLQLKDAANRYPDLVVLRPEHLDLMGRRLTITLDMPPPRIVVEVVSPGQANRNRDYINKRAQYAAIGVPEYWLIDSDAQTVMVLQLQKGNYCEVGTFCRNAGIVSPTFPALVLTAERIFQA